MFRLLLSRVAPYYSSLPRIVWYLRNHNYQGMIDPSETQYPSKKTKTQDPLQKKISYASIIFGNFREFVNRHNKGLF